MYCEEICEKVQEYLSEIFSEYDWKCSIEKSFAEIASSNIDVLLLTWTNLNDKISIVRRLKDENVKQKTFQIVRKQISSEFEDATLSILQKLYVERDYHSIFK